MVEEFSYICVIIRVGGVGVCACVCVCVGRGGGEGGFQLFFFTNFAKKFKKDISMANFDRKHCIVSEFILFHENRQ